MDSSQLQLIRCPACGALNRVPLDKIWQGLEPVCGRCKTPLPVNDVITVTDATFPEEVERSTLPVLVDLWAEWCGPCRMIAPVVDQLAKEMVGRLKIAKLDIDQNPVTASRFQIQSIPALLVVKGGREVDRIIGAQPKSEIVRRLQQWIA
ncbi:MAG: thioredoxin [Bryobacterales bacterium]|jgi:thioredoxin 2|nr:thioredoxin [Bryobacterales bacterium]